MSALARLRAVVAATVSWLDSRAADAMVRILLVASVVMVGWVAYEQNRQTSCQTRYAEANARSAVERTKAAEEDRKAIDDLMHSVITAKAAADVRQALLTYEATRAAADEKRARNPAPAPPSSFCG